MSTWYVAVAALAAALALGAGAPPAAQKRLSAWDPKVRALLTRMTLEEKIGQMTQPDQSSLVDEKDIETYFLGSLLSGGDSDPKTNSLADWTEMYDRYQSRALRTRLRIPLLYGVDAVHGHNNVPGAVVFPHNIGLGATRNPKLVEQIGRITAQEVRATGIQWVFAPCVAVPRDERWGRTYEGFSEDPQLVAALGAAAVRGLAALRRAHMAGYVATLEAGVGSIMPSYSSWNGRKMSGHHRLLTEVLKEEMGFEGFLISDYDAIDQLPGDYRSDIKESINAGMDMVMVTSKYREFFATLRDLVLKGEVQTSRIDDAVRRILRVKFALGLFDEGRSSLADRRLHASFGAPSTGRSRARPCASRSCF